MHVPQAFMLFTQLHKLACCFVIPLCRHFKIIKNCSKITPKQKQRMHIMLKWSQPVSACLHVPSSRAMMMEAARTSETSVDNYFTRQYIPEDKSELHTSRRENLKSHIALYSLALPSSLLRNWHRT
jgi:hypothetical protein